MPNQPAPEELLSLRREIDRIDEELLDILARRFAVTGDVGRLKADNKLRSLDPVREREKLERLSALAKDKGLNPAFVLALYRMVFDEVVKNHESYLE